jgi:hypothetical protein
MTDVLSLVIRPDPLNRGMVPRALAPSGVCVALRWAMVVSGVVAPNERIGRRRQTASRMRWTSVSSEGLARSRPDRIG